MNLATEFKISANRRAADFKSAGESANAVACVAENAASAANLRHEKPRVLMVGMHLTKTRGGISTLTAEILNSSLRDDFDFDYIASQAEEFGKFGKLILSLQAIAKFLLKCSFRAPALCYVHVGSNASLYRESLFIVLAKIFGLPVVAHFHAGDFDDYFPFQTTLGRWFISRALDSSDEIVAVSEESAQKLRKLVARPRVRVLVNAIDTRVFAPDGAKTLIPNQPVRLLFVGAIGKLKGERDLIRALQILRERRSGGERDLKVSFLGYGAETLQPTFEAANIADWVEFAGAVSLQKRIEFFRRADVFVLPTLAEAMPMSVIEAMAAELAVVSTNVGGIPEMIENAVEGWLVAPSDAAALAEKIEFFIENKFARREFGARAGRRAREHFDVSIYAARLRELLFAALENKRSKNNARKNNEQP